MAIYIHFSHIPARRKLKMPFANFKTPQAALTKAQKEELVHRTTQMFVDYFGEGVRPYTMVLIEEVADGGYGRADAVFVIPDAYRTKDA
jgi:4-oxalocrotonate tautomerase